MLGSHNHECYTVECIRAGCVNTEFLIVRTLYFKVYERAGGFADPVDLLKFDIGEIINRLQALKQFVGVLRYAEIPYILRLLDNFRMADVAVTAL